MRLALICLNFPPEPTGVAAYTGALADYLVKRGADVRVITGVPHYPQWQVYDGYGKSCIETSERLVVARRRHSVPARPQLLNRLAMELTFGLNAVMARWNRPDVVVLVSPALFSSILAWLKAALFRRPVVVWVQDIYSLAISQTGRSGSLGSKLMAWAERALLKRAQAVVAIHERFKRYLVSELAIDPEKVSVIRNWCHIGDPPSLSLSSRIETRKQLGWRSDVTVLLHAGNMGVKQDLGNLVEASRLADKRGEPLLFVLMGDGSERHELEAMGANRCLQIIDPLPPESFPAALYAADALVVNERAGVTEMAVPSKLTSYFASGRPVLAATDAGSVTAEEIELSGAGIRVDAERPDLLVEAALELLKNPQRSARLGANGHAFRNAHLVADASLSAFHRSLSAVASRTTPRRAEEDGGDTFIRSRATTKQARAKARCAPSELGERGNQTETPSESSELNAGSVG
jgi:colanic acid biosynthesis glycosyl transferase WcaI